MTSAISPPHSLIRERQSPRNVGGVGMLSGRSHQVSKVADRTPSSNNKSEKNRYSMAETAGNKLAN